MYCSIQEANLHNIQVLLDHNFSPNYALNPLGLTALHYAASSRYPQIMQTLLKPDYGADVNHPDSLGRTALSFAAAAGNLNVIGVLLLAPGLVVDSQSLGGETPLMRAA